MAIQCKYCGADLPKDDARFCTKCGMLVPSHPFSPQSLSASKGVSKTPGPSSSNEQKERHKHVLHEQVAELSPSRSGTDRLEPDMAVKSLTEREPSHQPSLTDEALLEKLPETPQPGPEEDAPFQVAAVSQQLSPGQAGMRRRIPRPTGMSSSSSPAWPAPVTHVSRKEPSAPAKDRAVEQSKAAPLSVGSPNNEAASAQKVHVNVVEEEQHVGRDGEENSIEDVPTQVVDRPVEDLPTQMVGVPVEDVPTQVVDRPVEDLPTRAMAVPVEKPARVQEQAAERVPANPFLSVPSTQAAAQQNMVEDSRERSKVASSEPVNSFASSTFQSNAVPFVSSHDQPIDVSAHATRDNGDAASAFPMRRKRQRWPIIAVLLLLVVLVIGGVVVAIMTSQQASPDPMTQPQVGFSDTQLGLSLLYPNGWIKQVDTGTSTAHFYASNHVGEVDIMVSPASGNAKQALQQQATKMGMGSKKVDTALTFAGASWQKMQGTMELSGASYADTILVTIHGGQLYSIVQQAPQSTYADWEKEFFAPLRTSFKFL